MTGMDIQGVKGRFGPGARIIAAVLVMGLALVAALLPLMRGLEQNARMEQEVSEVLVPESIRVMTLVNSLLEAQSAIERYLVTLDEGDRERFENALEMARITLAGLGSADLSADPDAEKRRLAVMDGVSGLVDKLETQAFALFEQSHKPDNVAAVHLINTRGEQLLDRTSALVDLVMDRWIEVDPSGDHLVLSALMGYQDSASRMMSALRGYLFMKDESFKQQYFAQRTRNERIFTTVREKLSRRDLALASRIEHLAATREKMVRVMDHAIVERDSAGWRRDFDFYRNDLAPTLESLKWVLQTLSDSSNQDITRVIADTTRYGMALKERTLVSVAVLLAVGLLLAGWIHRWVGVFNRQIGGAVVSLDRLAARMRRETEGQALEARNQVEEISGVYTNLHDLEASLTRIREQTEKMALQTDSASLECVQGMEVLAYSQDRMAAILQQVRDISQAMELTKSQTGRMDGILAILNELVDQTKLLSFNATIEAAGAGESGARFAVVAKQVRHLANRAREATQDIHEMIRRVQRNAEETRAATERGTAAVNEGENLMQVVTERLDLIVGSVSEVSDLAGGVFLATQAQTKSLSRVNRFVGEAKATAERVDRNSRGTLGTAEELATTAQGLSLLLGRRRELDMESPSTDPATPATPEAPEGGAGVPPDPGPES